MTPLRKPALPALTELVALLVNLDITPLHLHADSIATDVPRAELTLWTHTRTEFERLTAHLKTKRHESRYTGTLERRLWAETKVAGCSLLIHCTSLPHHGDWEPRAVTS